MNSLYATISGLTTGVSGFFDKFVLYDDMLSGLANGVDYLKMQIAEGLVTDEDISKLEEFKELIGVSKIEEVMNSIKNQILTTEIRISTDATVDIAADEVIRYTPVNDGVVNITAVDATHYGSCIAFITLGATNAVTFNYNGSNVIPLDTMVANKTNQMIIEIIGNGTTNDINVTLVRSW